MYQIKNSITLNHIHYIYIYINCGLNVFKDNCIILGHICMIFLALFLAVFLILSPIYKIRILYFCCMPKWLATYNSKIKIEARKRKSNHNIYGMWYKRLGLEVKKKKKNLWWGMTSNRSQKALTASGELMSLETNWLVQRILGGGFHVSGTCNFLGVPAFRLGGLVEKTSDDRFHFRHEL